MTALRWGMLPLTLILGLLALHSFVSTPPSLGFLIVAAVSADGANRSESMQGNAARRYLAVKPLSAEAVLALAEQGDRSSPAAAAHLVHRAVELEPRLKSARLWLAHAHAQDGNLNEVIRQIEALYRLDAAPPQNLLRLLAEAARTEPGRSVIATRFANRPEIVAIVAAAEQAGLSADALLELVAPTRLSRLPDAAQALQQLLARKLLKEQRYQAARTTWYRLGGREPMSLVYDGSFDEPEGPPPFGWSLTNTSDMQTRLGPGGASDRKSALSAEAFGSLRAQAAAQTLVLEQGRYRLSYRARYESGLPRDGTAEFNWSVACAGSAPLTEAFIPASPEWRRETTVFSIPADCPVQTLVLSKRATPARSQARLLVAAVAVVPVDR